MSFEGSNDALAELLVDDRVRGKSYKWISDRHGIPVEEVISIIREYYTDEVIRDPAEHRALLQLRYNRIIDKLWDYLDNPDIAAKAATEINRATDSLRELHALNEEQMQLHVNVILDEDAAKVFEVLKRSNAMLYQRLTALPLSQRVQQELVAWPEWAAEASTDAVQQVIYAEEVQEDE